MRKLLCIIIGLALVGCVSVGRKLDQSKVEQIKKGETSRAQVLQLVGSPEQIMRYGNGQTTFSYHFIRATPKASNFIPIAGAFAGGAKVQNEMLMVTFGTNGIVSDVVSTIGATEADTGFSAASAAGTNDLAPVVNSKRGR
jgi:outer membrane protein assembly factor BamE (lipoprotein component of BamABCDE complex)